MENLKWIVSENHEYAGNKIDRVVATFESKILAEDFIELVIPKDIQCRYKISCTK